MAKPINIGLIGYGFMGRLHSNAYAQVGKLFNPNLRPVLKCLCARDRDKAASFASTWGWGEMETDWRRLVSRRDIDLVDICTPNDTHCPIALEAARQAKMIVLEKPLALNAEEGLRMVEAVERSGRPNMVCFNYRRLPAVALAKQMMDEGRLARIFHYRAKFLQDWTMSPELPQGGETLWRLDVRAAGSGVTGDLLSHSIDLALWLMGPIGQVTAATETFIKERRLREDPGRIMPVQIDDACAFVARFENGALGTFEASRYARGRKNQHTFEINGEHGSIAFDLEEAHVLEYFDHRDPSLYRGFRPIKVWDGDHPYMKNWWVTGIPVGFEHTFVNMMADFLEGIESGRKVCPDFRDAYHVQLACDAVLESARTKSWVSVG